MTKMTPASSGSHFLHHESCPRCKSRDNLGVYSDGHKWCFGCGYYVPAKRTMQNIRSSQKKDEDNAWGLSFSDRLPASAISWLRRYGLSNEEIAEHPIKWEEKNELLCFVVYENGAPVFVNGRCFGKDAKSKYYTRGTRPYFTLGVHSDCLVFVEDWVSAIKVGNADYTSFPLFGAYIPPEALNRALSDFDRVVVWLDQDKAKVASQVVLRASLAYPGRVVRVTTDKDPKEYSYEEIRGFINNRLSESGELSAKEVV